MDHKLRLLTIFLIFLLGCLNKQITADEARSIAQNSECTINGTLKDDLYLSRITESWIVSINRSDSCINRCEINPNTKTAKIHIDCTID